MGVQQRMEVQHRQRHQMEQQHHSSSKLGLGSSNSWLVNWDNSTVGVSNKSSDSVWVSSSIGIWVTSIRISGIGVWEASNNWVDHTTSLSMSQLGSSHSGFISRDHSTIGVGDQLS